MSTSNTSFSTSISVPVFLEPALPYLFLPPAFCNSLVRYLPLLCNSGLGLYTWETSNPSLLAFSTSLSSLEFTFADSIDIWTVIAIALARLNPTLVQPLGSSPTSHFPCRLYSDDATGRCESGTLRYYLGRAFLQGAFIGHNGDPGSRFLAHAPGPTLPSSRVSNIGPTDTSVSALIQAPR